MWTRYRVATPRKIATHRKSIAKYMEVAQTIVEMLCYHEARKTRKLQYLLGSKLFRFAAIKTMFIDWAVTLGVHPWSLGVMNQDRGVVSAPGGKPGGCYIIRVQLLIRLNCRHDPNLLDSPKCL